MFPFLMRYSPLFLLLVTLPLVQPQNCTVAPASHICVFPQSGNVLHYVGADNYDSCKEFNKPTDDEIGSSTVSQAENCLLSEQCIISVARYYCSSLCSSCSEESSNATVLPPCKDLCDNFTKCGNDFKHQGKSCLPPLPSPCHPTVLSTDPDSHLVCSYVDINFEKFPDDFDGATSLFVSTPMIIARKLSTLLSFIAL